MAPIKVGFIGLTSNISTHGGTQWAVKAHLDYLKDNGGKYEIVALLNSSKEKAEAAKSYFKLGDGVKSYGNPEEFAADPNIDLVVCSVRVDLHYPTIKPSILAKKDVFAEWPLGSNLQEAEELLALANQGNIKTAIGLQAKFSPIVEKVKQLIDDGKVGRVFSSTFVMDAMNGGPTVPETVRYIVDRKVGGNLLTIHFAHSIEYVLYVLGNFRTWNSLMANQRSTVNVVSGDNIIEKNVKKSTPDQIMIQGTTTSGAVISFHLREDIPFPNSSGLEWYIYGDKGEIRITSNTAMQNIGSDDTKIVFSAAGSTEVEEIAVGKDKLDRLAWPGRNIARVYEAFAEGKRGEAGYRDFEHAVERHKLIDEMYKRFDEQGQ